MSMYKIERPIGLNSFCEEINDICEKSQIYRRIRPKHLIVNISTSEERKTCLEYMTGMFKKYHIIPFTSSLDSFVEAVIDGSSSKKIQQTFNIFSSAADYDNDFGNIAGLVITDMSNYMSGSQLNDFLKGSKQLCESACVVFFTAFAPNQNEEKLIKKLVEFVGDNRIKRISIEAYTKEEMVDLIKKIVLEFGVEIQNESAFSNLLTEAIADVEKNDFTVARSIAETLIHYADFDKFIPILDETSVTNLIADLTIEKSKGEKK